MKNLKKYKVILWDFDGVILNSMSIRELGFRNVLKDYPEDKVEKLIQFHYKNGGWSRYVKFRYFFEQILEEEASKDSITELCNEFSKIMLELLSSRDLLIQDSLTYIMGNYLNQEMHIVSGSDQIELRKLNEELEISHFFKTIHGSPTPKTELVKNLLRTLPYSLNEVALIGDSMNDLEAANLNFIDFYGYNNIELQTEPEYIYSFNS